MKINYVIATYDGKCNRKHNYPLPEDVLKTHLNHIINLKHNISQITIMKPPKTSYYKTYYDIENIIKKANIPIVILDCDNFGYSGGQFLKSYEKTKNQFDYYFFMEDDYVPLENNFDNTLIDIYKKKFQNNIGILSSLVRGSKDNSITHPIHYEGHITISNDTLNKVYLEFSIINKNPYLLLDDYEYWFKITKNSFFNKEYKKKCLGGLCQLALSQILSFPDNTHLDYLDIKKNNDDEYRFVYWDDHSESLWLYYNKEPKIKMRKTNIKEDKKLSLIIPIQLLKN